MLSNLPPGVTESMLPGNRPEDQEWDEFCDWAIERMSCSNLSIEQLRTALRNGIEIAEDDAAKDRAQHREHENRLAMEIDERRTES